MAGQWGKEGPLSRNRQFAGMPDLTLVAAIESIIDRLTEQEATALDDEAAARRLRQQQTALFRRRAELMSVDIKPAGSPAAPFTRGARR